jgi:RHS repeat-associated protein
LPAAQTTSDLVEYRYDASGNRISTSLNGVTTTYLVDTNRAFAQVLEERAADGTLLANYVFGDEGLIDQSRDGVTAYYLPDGLGSVRALSNESGATTDTYTYDAFGVSLGTTGTTANTYRFAGEQFDPTVGFYYLRARYYDPAMGRFVTMDSFAGDMQVPLSLHKYLYAEADPINHTDPSGQQTLSVEMNAMTIRTTTNAIALPNYASALARAGQAAWALTKAVALTCATTMAVSYLTGAFSGSPCDISNFNILRPLGLLMPETTLHNAAAIASNPNWAVLTRGTPTGDPPRGWY